MICGSCSRIPPGEAGGDIATTCLRRDSNDSGTGFGGTENSLLRMSTSSRVHLRVRRGDTSVPLEETDATGEFCRAAMSVWRRNGDGCPPGVLLTDMACGDVGKRPERLRHIIDVVGSRTPRHRAA